MNKYIDYVRNALDERTKLEALAEESSELAKAALKMIRAGYMSNNTTPVSADDAELDMIEEILDVMSVIYILDYGASMNGIERYYKWRRWAERLGYSEPNTEREEDTGNE